MTDERPCCPECDTLHVVRPIRSDGWRCRQCGWSGPAPASREPRQEASTAPGLAGVLERMDADEVPP